jgi:hypothetical protein
MHSPYANEVSSQLVMGPLAMVIILLNDVIDNLFLGPNPFFSIFFPFGGALVRRACADLGLLVCPIGARSIVKKVLRAVVVVVVAAAAAKLLGRAGGKTRPKRETGGSANSSQMAWGWTF